VNHRGAHRSGASRPVALACLALLALATWTPPAARAADSVYWANGSTNTIRVGNLDGSGAAQTLFTEPGASSPAGVAIDPATGRIYWSNFFPDTIRVGNLDGSGAAQTLFTEGDGSNPQGVAIDPAANLIYWPNFFGNTIRVANLDGTGAAATLFAGEPGPNGPAIDPAANRIYWTNQGTNSIRVGNLDGSGTASTLFAEGGGAGPFGVAIDPAAGRIYWTNNLENTIRVGNLDGSGAAATLFAGENGPFGVSIDPAASRIYWANAGSSTIRVGNLDGSGAPQTLFAGESTPHRPVPLRSPAAAGAPAISGGGALGQPLSCTQGSWAPDLLGAFLYRAPRSFAFQWLRDGAEIPGATASSHTPTEAGSYVCRVTATNQAGSAIQTSAPIQTRAGMQVLASNDFRFGKLKRNKKKGIAFLTVIAPGPGQLGYRGQGESTAAGSGVATVSRRLSAAGSFKLKIKAGRFGKRSKRVRRRLKRTGRAKVKIHVTFVPHAGTAATKSRKLKLIRR
jgi:hypothetical protein